MKIQPSPCHLGRRTLLAGAAALVAFGRPAAAAPVPLAEISQYLNGIRTARAAFEQINPDGSRVRGRMMLHRPGRIRFEYDPPKRDLLIASGGTVSVFEGRRNADPVSYPLSATPLHLILQSSVDLSRSRMVAGVAIGT